jgi:hypothetical protein
MMTLPQLTDFLGWCTVINMGLMLLSLIAVTLFRAPATQLHAKMFGMDETALAAAYFQYLGQYKLLVILFNLVPYLALKMMA